MRLQIGYFLILFAGGLLAFHAPPERSPQTPSGKAPEGMIRIPAGRYTPFYSVNNDANTKQDVAVKSFFLDDKPVTNAEFLTFVKANPQWARSRIPALFADSGYLKHWKGDLEIGNIQIENSPVSNISWFAANAYSKWKGLRLPTLQEWEYAANAAPTGENKSVREIILAWYSQPSRKTLPVAGSVFRNEFGLYDMHGSVWEWVYDFNSIVMGGDSRSNSAVQRELFCASAAFGAADREDYASFMRFAFRGSLKIGRASCRERVCQYV